MSSINKVSTMVTVLAVLGDTSQLAMNISKILTETKRDVIKPDALDAMFPADLASFFWVGVVCLLVASEGSVLGTVEGVDVVGAGPLQ